MFDLSHKVIVIVGGSTGLGLSAAKVFVQAGAQVVVLGRNEENIASALGELGPNAAGLACDAVAPDSASRGIQLAIDQFSGFTGLYHVAGGSGRKFGDGPLHEITDESVSATIDLNFKSLLYSNRAALQQFLKQDSGGVILNMASVLGWSPSPKYFATHIYSGAKAAIIGSTKAAAAYYAPHDIRLNVIAPALVNTPMAQRAVQNDEITDYIRTKQPLDGGRVGLPEDLDGAAVWLMSDSARFVTGQVITVDGGWTLAEGQHR